MAEKGGRGARAGGKVVQLKPGTAKGAKAPTRAPSRLKADPSQGAALTQDQIDAQARKAQVERVAALTHQHRQMDNKIDAVKLTLDELNGEKKLVRTAIGNSGIRLEVFDERYEKLKLKTKRTDLQAIERERAICSEAMGLIVGEQAEMDFAKLPEGVKPAVHWRAVGYQAGVTGEACNPTEAGCPPEATQDYSKGWGEGQTVVAAGIKLVKSDQTKAKDKAKPANDAKAKDTAQTDIEDAAKTGAAAGTAPSAQPDWSTFSNDPADWSVQQRTIFRDWFDNTPPDVDVDIAHAGVECAWDRLNDGVDAFTGESSAATA